MQLRLTKACRTPTYKDRQRLIRIVERAARLILSDPPPPGLFKLILASRPLIRRLNEDFLDHAGDTDVIAFDYRGETCVDGLAVGPHTWAELYVCLPVAMDAAREHGTSVSFEVILYSIHGLLHLAGFSDYAPSDRRRMKRQEHRLMFAIEEEFGVADLFNA